MMAAVAVLATLSAATVRLHRVSLEHRRRIFELQQHIARQLEVKAGVDDPRHCFYPHRLSVELARNIEYCNRLKVKYERAARYPWLSVKPDPRAPE
jgi:hypothetical protein